MHICQCMLIIIYAGMCMNMYVYTHKRICAQSFFTRKCIFIQSDTLINILISTYLALAAALFGKCEIQGKTTVIIASGGNVDEAFFHEILNKYSYLD
jgi:hypothetical protein